VTRSAARSGRRVGVGVAPAFMPKRNSEPIVDPGRIADDATRLEIGEQQVRDHTWVKTRFRSGAGIRPRGDVVAGCLRHQHAEDGVPAGPLQRGLQRWVDPSRRR
jgi:hypothetical protein